MPSLTQPTIPFSLISWQTATSFYGIVRRYPGRNSSAKKATKKLLLNQHIEIFGAIRDHEMERAGEAAKRHILFVEEELKKYLNNAS